jgi:hypothetical protein
MVLLLEVEVGHVLAVVGRIYSIKAFFGKQNRGDRVRYSVCTTLCN